MSRGRFITLEGIEGAGKSTVARALVGALEAAGRSVTLTREPGGTPAAERLRAILLERGAETISPVTETLLLFAARSLHLDNVIRPAIAAGRWVVCDRFTDATRAYQGAGRGVDPALIETLARSVHDGLEPDLVLLLDLPAVDGLARARRRNAVRGGPLDDRFEVESLAFFERVRAAYLGRAAATGARTCVIDASRDATTVARDAIAAARQLG